MRSLKGFMRGQTTMVIGQITQGSAIYWLRLRRASGIGCVTAQIFQKGGGRAWSSGRFGDDASLAHLIDHVRQFNLADDATLNLSASAASEYAACKRLSGVAHA